MPRSRVQPATEASPQVFDSWFDPIETGGRVRLRECIEAMVEAELEAVLSRPRHKQHVRGMRK